MAVFFAIAFLKRTHAIILNVTMTANHIWHRARRTRLFGEYVSFFGLATRGSYGDTQGRH